jgi:predicted acylesterase/phospholipase RssA
MTDKEYRRTKKRVEKLIERWRHILWLSQWQVDVTYFREPPAEMNHGDACALMDITPRWEYLRAHLRIHMPQVALLDADDLEKAVLHELLHCVVCEMRTNKSDVRHEERVVSHLTKAVWAARLTGFNDAKSAK